jgi:Domain of unknown function (DUF4193)
MKEETLEEEEEDFPAEVEVDEEVAEDSGDEPAAAEEPDEASLDEILAKPGERPAEEEEEESILALGTEERLETLSVKVEPKKDTEFVCQKCYLVKPIRSQLADKVRMYCRDCA